MIKELIVGLVYIILITVIAYPISNYLADIMVLIMAPSILTSILINIVRFFGFFIGIGTINWVYKGLNLQKQQEYNGGF
jgi:ABC-type spermidine/putrescine transport system permease subunit I